MKFYILSFIITMLACKPIQNNSSFGVLDEAVLEDSPFPPLPTFNGGAALRNIGFGLSAGPTSSNPSLESVLARSTSAMPAQSSAPTTSASTAPVQVRNPLEGWGGWKPVEGQSGILRGSRTNGSAIEYYQTQKVAGPDGKSIWQTSQYTDDKYAGAVTNQQLQFQLSSAQSGQPVWASRPVDQGQDFSQAIANLQQLRSGGTLPITGFLDGRTSFQSPEGNYFVGQNINNVVQFRPLGSELAWQTMESNQPFDQFIHSGSLYQQAQVKSSPWFGALSDMTPVVQPQPITRQMNTQQPIMQQQVMQQPMMQQPIILSRPVNVYTNQSNATMMGYDDSSFMQGQGYSNATCSVTPGGKRT